MTRKRPKKNPVVDQDSFWKSGRERAYDDAELEDDDDQEDYDFKREVKKRPKWIPNLLCWRTYGRHHITGW